MPIINMQTESVYALANKIREISQVLKDQMSSLSSAVHGIDWEGDNRNQFVEEVSTLVTWANQQIEAGEVLSQRVEREVREWEEISARLGSDYSSIAQLIGAIKGNPSFTAPGWSVPAPISGSDGMVEQMPFIIGSDAGAAVQVGQVLGTTDRVSIIDAVTSRLWDTAKALLSTVEFITKNKALGPVTFAASTVDFFMVKMPEAESAFRAWEDYNRRTNGWNLAEARRLEEAARVQLGELGLSGVMDAFGTLTKTLGDHKIIGEVIVRLQESAYLAADWLAALGPKK